MSQLVISNVRAAFQGAPDLGERVLDIARRYSGEVASVLDEISRHVIQQASSQSVPTVTDGSVGGTASKKRKLDDQVGSVESKPQRITSPVLEFECKDVSIAIPARKKMKLQIVRDEKDRKRKEVQLVNQQTDEVDYSFPGEYIDQVFCLPVPDKPTRQSNFLIIPKPDYLSPHDAALEPFVYTLNQTPPKAGLVSTPNHIIDPEDTFVSLMTRDLNSALESYGKQVILPDANEFASSIEQAHRKGEKAYHVKAFMGSKEGYLFFTSHGIIFGFKKPLQFFPFTIIESISYTSVLQRTFNLVITTMNPGDSSESSKDYEYSMLDQADFAGIDAYIKAHELNDASMAAQRAAKMYDVNKAKTATNGDAEAGQQQDGVGEDGLTELQRAEQQIQDEEDDEEEDYDPSGGESEGEGEDSGEEGEEYEGEEYEEDEGEEVEEGEEMEYEEEE